MAKVFRVTAGDPPPATIPFELGDYVYIGVGESGEDVYGVYHDTQHVPYLVSKVRGTDRWAIGATGFTGGPPPAAWPPSILYGDLTVCLNPSGWDGGEDSGSEPPTGDYQLFVAGSGYREERLRGELIGSDDPAPGGWWPWCCLGCEGPSTKTPKTLCYLSQGPVPDFWVLLNITTPGETVLTGDYRAYGFGCAQSEYGYNESWSPVVPANCAQASKPFRRTILGTTYTYYVDVSLSTGATGPFIQVRLRQYSSGAWTTIDTWKKSYPSPVNCRAWEIPGEYIPHVVPGRETDRRCYLSAVNWTQEYMP